MQVELYLEVLGEPKLPSILLQVLEHRTMQLPGFLGVQIFLKPELLYITTICYSGFFTGLLESPKMMCYICVHVDGHFVKSISENQISIDGVANDR